MERRLCALSLPAIPAVQQIYPLPGATGVPANVGLALYAGSQPFPISLSGPTKVLTQATSLPSPLPSPAATPLAGLQTYAVAFGTLSSASTYSVTTTFTSGAACYPPVSPHQVLLTLGSFSTR